MTGDQLLSMERIDPLLVDDEIGVDRTTLQLHLDRYEFAGRFVADREVVDCACGTGYGSAHLASAGAAFVTGVDICPQAIAFAQKNHEFPNTTYQVMDAFQFVPSRSPEVWVTLETVEHLEEPERYLRSIHRHLTVDGLLIASVPTTVSTDGNPYHLHNFTRGSWRAMLKRAGFAIEHELIQRHRFSLGDIFGKKRGPRQKVRRSLPRYYLTHPGVLLSRMLLTMTQGLVNEYVVVCARRV